MNITKAEYLLIEGHPFLRLKIDGKEALIGEFKYSILECGYVPLSSRDPNVDWGEILPEGYIPDYNMTLTGFTNDPVILKMTHSFWKAINYIDGEKFKEGPVLIPQL
jgi:hypothetical protein